MMQKTAEREAPMEYKEHGIPSFPISERSKRVVVSVQAIKAHEESKNSSIHS